MMKKSNILLIFFLQSFYVGLKMLQSRILTTCFRQLSSQSIVSNICIVGAGPAGFYAAQQLLKVCS